MSSAELKNKLMTDRVKVKVGEHEIDGVGTIKFRGLSRSEVLRSGKIDDAAAKERFILSRAMIDPPMSEGDVEKWQDGSGAFEINDVAMKINALSGLTKDAAKEQYKSLPE